jgi:hypothetical protein
MASPLPATYEIDAIQAIEWLFPFAYNPNRSKVAAALREGQLDKVQLYDISTIDKDIPAEVSRPQVRVALQQYSTTKLEELVSEHLLAWKSLTKQQKLATLGFLLLLKTDKTTDDFLKALHQNSALADMFLAQFTQRFFNAGATTGYNLDNIFSLVNAMAAAGPENLFIDCMVTRLNSLPVVSRNPVTYGSAEESLRQAIKPENPIVHWTVEAVSKASQNVQDSLKIQGQVFVTAIKQAVSSIVYESIQRTFNNVTISLKDIAAANKKDSPAPTPVISIARADVAPLPFAEMKPIAAMPPPPILSAMPAAIAG